MPTIRSYPNGVVAFVPSNHTRTPPPPRQAITGWTEGAARRHLRWLYSIDCARLTGDGLAFTLTLRDCPPTAAHWRRAVRAWIKRMEYLGVVRIHWVVEWQARGVPHLHGSVWTDRTRTPELYDFPGLRALLVDAWCDVARDYGAHPASQHTAAMTELEGWLKYLAKHAGRGVRHYQRSNEHRPSGWASTGRLWGYTGTWPSMEPIEIDCTDEEYWVFRRLIRSRLIAEARATPCHRPDDEATRARRIRFFRRMLQRPTRPIARIVSVNQWLPQALQLDTLRAATRVCAAKGAPLPRRDLTRG